MAHNRSVYTSSLKALGFHSPRSVALAPRRVCPRPKAGEILSLGKGHIADPVAQAKEFILYSNKLSKVRILLTRSYILKLIAWKDISPYSGVLEKGMAEYRAYNKLFENKLFKNQEKVIRAYSKLKSSSVL
ncbi:hypothetical protein Holit_01504 [Hollandina sp. SP2]